jgi:hypothetical protein
MVNFQPITLSQIGRTPNLEELHANLQPEPAGETQRARDHFLGVAGRHADPVLVTGASDLALIKSLALAGHSVGVIEARASRRARLCRAALAQGFQAELYAVPVESLDLPRKYGSILIPSSGLTLLLSRAQALLALDALGRHLLPGGALSFDVSAPPAWQAGAAVEAEELKPSRDERLLAQRRLLSLDPVAQIYEEQRVFKLFAGDHLVRQSYRSSTRRWYSQPEITQLLAWAGFVEIQVTGAPLSAPDTPALVVTAKRGRSDATSPRRQVLGEGS